MFQLKPGMYIINTDIRSGAGIHWVAMNLTKKTAYFYDSFARDPKKILHHLTKRLKGFKIISSDRKDKEQKDLEIICGHLCCSFLSVVKDLGIRAAIKI